jgi:hypothetical protein
MRESQTIWVKLPHPVAVMLDADGDARLERGVRSPIPHLVVEGLEVVATTVTLLQGPTTARHVADAVGKWILHREHEPQQPTPRDTVTLRVRNPRCTPEQARLIVVVDGDTDQLTVFVEVALLGVAEDPADR